MYILSRSPSAYPDPNQPEPAGGAFSSANDPETLNCSSLRQTTQSKNFADGGVSYVNKRTRIRDHERAPIAADLKSAMREKSIVGGRTFALTADVAEALGQVPIGERIGIFSVARSSGGPRFTSTKLALSG